MGVSLSLVLSTGVSAAVLHIAIGASVWRGTGKNHCILGLPIQCPLSLLPGTKEDDILSHI